MLRYIKFKDPEIGNLLYPYFKKIVVGVINGTNIRHSWANFTTFEYKDLVQEGIAYCYQVLHYYKKYAKNKRNSPFSFFSVVVKRHLIHFIEDERKFVYEKTDYDLDQLNHIYEHDRQRSNLLFLRFKNSLINKEKEARSVLNKLTYYKYIKYKRFIDLVPKLLKSKNINDLYIRITNLSPKEKNVLSQFISKDDLEIEW